MNRTTKEIRGNKIRNIAQLTALTAAVAMLLSACGGGPGSAPQKPGDGKAPPEKEKSPITLRMLQDVATITDEEFANMIAAPVKAKFPHITVELVRNTKGNDGISNLIAGGEFPDLIFTTYPQIKVHREMGTAQDLTALIQSQQFDTNRFDPAALETSRIYGGGKLYAIPFSLNFLALFYNQELFDRFGVSYPKDGITWDETIALARQFSRVLENVEYKGIMIPGTGDLSTQLSLARVNADTKKAAIASDGWKRVFQLIKDVNDIPGNKGAVLNDFLVKQNLAMMPSYDARFAALEKLHGTAGDFKWDVTQFPSHRDYPNRSLASSGHFLLVSELGKHKEDAFEVIKLLTSDANQNLITEHGRFTSLRNEEIRNKYGVNMKSMQGKNIKAVFKSEFAPPYTPTEFDKFVTAPLNEAVKKMVDNGADMNTVIREAEEKINRTIEEELRK